MTNISNTTIDFLRELKQHNNREWFQKHKEWYERSHEEMIGFTASLLDLMKTHDHIEEVSPKKCLFRIYRDVRFSKDKSPYKTNWGGSLKRATRLLRGGYYYHIEPGNSFAGGGFWNPNADDIKLIRSHLAFDATPLDRISSDPAFVKTFGTIKGDKLKNPPRGYSADDPAVEWLKHKQFLVMKPFNDSEVTQADFVRKVNDTFQKMRPFFDYMSEILTTNLNGEPIYD